MRSLFFGLAGLSVLPMLMGFADLPRMNRSLDRATQEASKAEAKLKSFRFDANGSVPADQRSQFEWALQESKMAADSIRSMRAAKSNAELYAFGGLAGVVGCAAIGYFLGRRGARPATS